MAVKLEGDIGLTLHGNRKYDWDSWLDGNQWMLVRGEDYSVSTASFRVQAQTLGATRGLRVITKSSGVRSDEGKEAIVIQAVPRD